MRRLLLLGLAAATAHAQPTVRLADGWGNLPLSSRPLMIAGGYFPELPVPWEVRLPVELAGTFALARYPALFAVPSEPYYPVRDGNTLHYLYVNTNRGIFGIYVPDDGVLMLNARTLGTADEMRRTHTALHETFHAFQQATAWGRRGDAPDWIVEGTADAAAAVAYGAMPDRRERDLYVTGSDTRRGESIGARPYDYPLHRIDLARTARGYDADTPLDYYTSSFWRYVASFGPERGRLLGQVLARTPSGSSDAAALEAVDDALKASRAWQGGIAQALPAFLADFIDRPARENYPAIGTLYGWTRWPGIVFRDEGCPAIELGEGNTRWSGPLTIRPVAARCRSVRLAYDDALPSAADSSTYYLSVEARSLDPTDCRALALGTRGRTVPALRIERPASGGCRVTWIAPYAPVDPARTRNEQAFVFTNVWPEVPSATTEATYEVTISVPTAVAEATGTSVQPGQPASQIPPTRGRRRGGRARSRIPNAATASRTEPEPEAAAETRATCDPARLAANLCGPQTRITLSLGELGEVAAVSTAGLMSGALVQGPLSPLVGEVQADAAVMPGAVEGVTVELLIPQIEPGFTGTIRNADVRVEWVTRTETGELDASGPRVAATTCSPNPSSLSGAYLPTGEVTIEYAGTDAIHGRFSATLYEDDHASLAPCDAVRRTAGRVSGTFTTAAGATFYEEPPAPLVEDLRARMFDHLPPEALSQLDYRIMLAAVEGAAAEGGEAPAGGEGGIVGYEPCACTCAEVGGPEQARCAPICGAAYDACAVENPTEAELLSLLDRLMQDAPPAVMAQVRTAYLDEFRRADEEQRRQIIALVRQQVEGAGG